MTNTRIKDIPGIAGAKAEAVASTITLLYDPVDPANTKIIFAYRDYLTNSEGTPVGMAGDNWTTLQFTLAEAMEWDLPDMPAGMLLEGIRTATDYAHNLVYGAANEPLPE